MRGSELNKYGRMALGHRADMPERANWTRHFSARFFAHVLLLTTLIATVSACQGGNNDRGFVQREWSKSMRELGIVPVFPPREDLLVGDVYAYDFNPDDPKSQKIFETAWDDLDDGDKAIRSKMGMSPRLARWDVSAELSNEYKLSMAVPATPTEYNSILGNPAVVVAEEQLKSAKAGKAKAVAAKAAAKKVVDDAAKKLGEVTTKKKEADSKVTAAKKDLDDRLKKWLEDSQASEREAEIKEIEAQTAVDADPGAANIDELKRNLQKAKNDHKIATLNVEHAQAGLPSKGFAPKNVQDDLTALEGVLEITKTEQAEQGEKVKTETENHRVADAAFTENKPGLEKKITAAQGLVTQAENLVTAMKAATAKMLYPQPRDATYNIYDGSPLGVAGKRDDLQNARVNRLRLVAFPEFSTVSFSQSDLTSLIPIEAMNFGLNISATNVDRVSVNIPSAESYSLSVREIYTALLEGMQSTRQADLDIGMAAVLEGQALNLTKSAAGLERQADAAQTASDEAKIRCIAAADNDPKAKAACNAAGAQREAAILVLRNTAGQERDEAKTLSDKALLLTGAARAIIVADGHEVEADRLAEEDNTKKAEAQRIKAAEKRLEARQLRLAAGYTTGSSETSSSTTKKLLASLHDAALFQTGKAFGHTQLYGIGVALDSLEDEDTYYVRVATEVYYARALDVSLFTSSSFGARAQLAPATLSATPDGETRTPQTQFAVDGSATGSASGQAAIDNLVKRIGTTQEVPGGAVQFVGLTERSIGLRRVFDRPVAIGFRGITLRVFVNSGKIAGVVVSNTPITTFIKSDWAKNVT